MNSAQRPVILVDRQLQWHWGLLIGILSVSGMLVGILALLVLPVVISAFSQRRMYAPMTVGGAIHSSWLGIVLAAAAVLAFAVCAGIFFGHKVADPVYRLQRVLAAKLRGERTGPILLREKDYFHEVFELLSDLFSKEDDVHEICDGLIRLLDRNLATPEAKGAAGLVMKGQDLTELLEGVARLKNILDSPGDSIKEMP